MPQNSIGIWSAANNLFLTWEISHTSYVGENYYKTLDLSIGIIFKKDNNGGTIEDKIKSTITSKEKNIERWWFSVNEM